MLFGWLAVLMVVVIIVLGLLSALRFFIRIFFDSGLPASTGAASRGFAASREPDKRERDAMRSRLETMYFEKKISLDEMNRILNAMDKPSEPINKAPFSNEPKPAAKSQPEPFFAESPKPAAASAPYTSRVSASGHAPVSETSGFFSTTAVKTLLVSGSALFVFSVYLFVRSYWDFIPAALKFAGLALTTALFYGAGFMLWKKNQIPRTAKTLVALGLAMIPFNAYAANVLLFQNGLSVNAVWAAGSAAMIPFALLTAALMPSSSIGFLIGASVMSTCYFLTSELAVEANNIVRWTANLTMALGSLGVLVGAGLYKKNEDLRAGLATSVNVGFLCNLLLMSRFFPPRDNANELMIGLTFLVMGITFAIESRIIHANFAYLAGLSLMGSGLFLLRVFDMPSYQYGYFYVPAGLAALLRAWTFERAGRGELAKPYFLLGQAALVVSMLAVFPTFDRAFQGNLSSLILLLGMVCAAYAAAGVIFGQPVYTYASAGVTLLMMWTFIFHRGFDFALGTLLFTAMACVFLVAGFAGGFYNEERVGEPLTYMGLGTLSLAVAMLAGRWGGQYLTTGAIAPSMPTDQLNAGLWTGTLGAAAYLFLSTIKKRPTFLYPALFSASWVYICFLEKTHLPINILNMSWIVVASLLIYYALTALGREKPARCFLLWGQMVSLFIAMGAIASRSELAFLSMLICTLAFVPGLWEGRASVVGGFLTGVYLTHLVWFSTRNDISVPRELSEYALQLVLINCGVVFFRTLFTYARPDHSVMPYRAFALVFSVVSLVFSLFDLQIAWQVYLAYALIGFLVSWIHYEGRYNSGAGLLLLASAELFLASRNIHYREMYTLPIALFLFYLGYKNRATRDIRDFLYGIGQLVLYVPSSIDAMSETWELHGIFLGVASLVFMLFGIQQKNKVLAFGSAFVLVVNGLIQSHQFFLTVPRWIYLGGGGLFLICLGGLFEFKREALVKMKGNVAEAFEDWE